MLAFVQGGRDNHRRGGIQDRPAAKPDGRPARRDLAEAPAALARVVGNRAFGAMIARNGPGKSDNLPVPHTQFGPDGELLSPLAEGVAPMPFIRHFAQPSTEGKKNLDFEQSGTQKMVPSAKDLIYLGAVMDPTSSLFVEAWRGLTANQVWALIAADYKAFTQRARDVEACEHRLDELNERGAKYVNADLPDIFDYMREGMRLATNLALSKPPPGDAEPAKDAKTLEELLMEDKDGRFRNVWETQASQASASYTHRGGVEERMGYGSALKRTAGKFFDFFGTDNTFEMEPTSRPSTKDPDEMPKYAALIPQNQPAGVAYRYGKTVFYWKPALRSHTTHTAGDSWSSMFVDRSIITYAGGSASWRRIQRGLHRVADPRATQLGRCRGDCGQLGTAGPGRSSVRELRHRRGKKHGREVDQVPRQQAVRLQGRARSTHGAGGESG